MELDLFDARAAHYNFAVSSRPVRMTWPRATARRLTAQAAMPSPWWTCSIRTPPSASARSMASACGPRRGDRGRQQAGLDPDSMCDELLAPTCYYRIT